MKQLLLTALLTLVSFVGFSQYKNVNQKLYFVNGIKIGDTLKVDSAGIYGSGHFLKIQDTTTSPWTVIRSEIDATDTSFFKRTANGTIQPKTETDSLYLGSNLNATELNLKGQFTQSKGEALLDNTVGGAKLLVLSGAHNVDTITYGGGLRVEVGDLVNERVGTFLTIVGTSGVVDDSAAVFLDSPPFYLNGNDTLGSGDILQLYIYNEAKFLEVSRSDN